MSGVEVQVRLTLAQLPPYPAKRNTSPGQAKALMGADRASVVTVKMIQVNAFVRKHFVHLISIIALVAFLTPRIAASVRAHKALYGQLDASSVSLFLMMFQHLLASIVKSRLVARFGDSDSLRAATTGSSGSAAPAATVRADKIIPSVLTSSGAVERQLDLC